VEKSVFGYYTFAVHGKKKGKKKETVEGRDKEEMKKVRK
jgi:hypothetical protein